MRMEEEGNGTIDIYNRRREGSMLSLAYNTYCTVRDIRADSHRFPESELCPKYRITAAVLRDGGKVRVA